MNRKIYNFDITEKIKSEGTELLFLVLNFNRAFLHETLFTLFCLAKLRRDYDQAQVDHKKWTNDNQEDEIDKAEKRMSVHNIVHDVHPSF